MTSEALAEVHGASVSLHNIASTICIGVREYKGAGRNSALSKVLLSAPTLASSARLSVLIAVV